MQCRQLACIERCCNGVNDVQIAGDDTARLRHRRSRRRGTIGLHDVSMSIEAGRNAKVRRQRRGLSLLHNGHAWCIRGRHGKVMRSRQAQRHAERARREQPIPE
jgi:hypothetical protein